MKLPSIKSLSNLELERFVAAIFQSSGYYVERDLTWQEDRLGSSSHTIDVLQADAIAYSFSSFEETRILIECKGGGSFNDLFKFIGIKNIVKPNSSYFVCNNTLNFDEIHKLGSANNIVVTRPEDFLNNFKYKRNIQNLTYWYWINQIIDSLLTKERLIKYAGESTFTTEENLAYQTIRKYYATIKGRIWKESDPLLQVGNINSLFNTNKGFVRKVLLIQRLPSTDTENAITNNVLCESAAYVVLRAKIIFIISALRCAINSFTSTSNNFLASITDQSFLNVVNKLIESIDIACRLPKFIQFWIFQCGGLLNTQSNEVSIFAKFLGEREETISQFINLLKEIFTLIISNNGLVWSLNERNKIIEFNAVPDSLRGFGMYFREQLNISITPFVYRKQWLDKFNVIKTIV